MGVSLALAESSRVAGIGVAGGRVVGVRDDLLAFVVLPEIPVSPAGHTIPVSWAGAAGATEVEVTRASLRAAAPRTAHVESVEASPADGQYQLTLGAHRRLRAIGLVDAKRGEEGGGALVTAADLEADPGRRLVVYATDAAGQMAARYAVPRVGPRGGIPAQFGGASFDGGVVSFPELATTRVRVGLVDRTDTQDWALQPLALASRVNATVVVLPADLSLTTDDGASLWAFPGELGDEAGIIEADVAAPLQGALTKRLTAGLPLAVTLTLKAANDATVGFDLSGPSGALVRRVPGVVSVALAGAPLAPAIAGGPVAAERPSQVTADVVVRYAGIRLLDAVNDPMPNSRAVSGAIVGAAPLRRALPPESLRANRVARVGIVGRSPEGCELSVQLVDAGPSLAPLTDPGVYTVPASDDLAVWWVDLVQDEPSASPPAISVRATSGRFFWVTDGEPLARVAVHDPDPGGRPVRLGGGELVRLTSEVYEAKGASLAAAPFAAPLAAFDSTLFVTIELGDLTLRYAR